MWDALSYSPDICWIATINIPPCLNYSIIWVQWSSVIYKRGSERSEIQEKNLKPLRRRGKAGQHKVIQKWVSAEEMRSSHCDPWQETWPYCLKKNFRTLCCHQHLHVWYYPLFFQLDTRWDFICIDFPVVVASWLLSSYLVSIVF